MSAFVLSSVVGHSTSSSFLSPIHLQASPAHQPKKAALSMVLAQRPSSSNYQVTERKPRKKGRLSVEFDIPSTQKQLPASSSFDGEALQASSSIKVVKPKMADDYRWARGGYNQLERSVAVWTFIAQVVLKFRLTNQKWSYVGGFSEEKKSKRLTELGIFARETILDLGPTFIKLGQLFSARADLLPKEIVAELSLLQDRVPAFSFEAAKKMVESELEEPLDILFDYFDPVPLAAASLGQVHRARLMTGEEIVVKIQRPGLKQLFDLDLEALRIVANYFQRSKKYGGPTRDWIGIYDECKKILNEEIDYENEADNAEKFANIFKDTKWIRIPKVYRDYTTKRVISLQYVPGIKVTNIEALKAAGLDPKLIAERTSISYLKQILEAGFFHADLHPANVAVGPGNMLYYYDFGMMGTLKEGLRLQLLDILIAIVDKDAMKVVDIMIDLGVLVNVTPDSKNSIRRFVQYFLDNLTNPKTFKSRNAVAVIRDELYTLAKDKPFRIPATFSFVLRAFSLLEGVNRTLDPEFKFATVATPYGQVLFEERKKSLASQFNNNGGAQGLFQRLRQQTLTALPQALNAPEKINRIDKVLAKLELGDIKLNAKSSETERLLRIQNDLVQNNSLLFLSCSAAILAAQVYTNTAGDIQITGLPASAAAILALIWMKRARDIQRDPLRNFNRSAQSSSSDE